jgi:hypothetical protein
MPYIHPTEPQQLAVQARLNMLLGRTVFDKYFLGFEIRDVRDHTINVVVQGQVRAEAIEANYSLHVAIVAESILRHPIKFVNVLPKQCPSRQD